MTILTPPDNSWPGKRILLRLDLNVPLANGRIADDFKLRAALPTIRRFGAKAALIIVSHLGSPKSSADRRRLSLRPAAVWLRRRLGGRVAFASLAEARTIAPHLQRGDILILENIRFEKGETENDATLAKRLAALADIMINDAFAVTHRKHASVAAVSALLPTYAGPLLASEVKALDHAKQGKSPLVAVIGGAKISTKLPLLKQLSDRATVLVGGAVANTLLAAAGYPIGTSLAEQPTPVMRRLLASGRVMLPLDVMVEHRKKTMVKDIADISRHDRIIDIVPQTVRAYSRTLATAKTIIWNGPLGVIEHRRGRAGTIAVAKAIASRRSAFTVIGGGETVSAVAAATRKKFSWVSTGGGATLAFLSGQPMPGLRNSIRR